MKKTQRRRKLFGKTRRRRQRGGQLSRRAFVYLALFAWVFALLPKVTAEVRETTVWDVAKWTARDIGEAAQGYFESLKSKTPIVLPVGKDAAIAGAKILEAKSKNPSFQEAAERVASIAVDAYETGDKMSIDFSLVAAEKAGEAIVTAGSYVNGFFDGLSGILLNAATNLEQGNPVLPLIEDEAKVDETAVPASPSMVSPSKLQDGATYKDKNGKQFTVDTWANRGDYIEVSIENPLPNSIKSFRAYPNDRFELVSLPKEGEYIDGGRKARRKTLRRKK